MKTTASKKLQTLCVAALACTFAALSVTPRASAQTGPKRLITQSVDESQRATLRGNVHPWARAEFDQGSMEDGQPVNRIYLLLNRSAGQQAALDKLMFDQLDKNSPSYHQWLTPEQYGAQFGPADEDVQAVKNWLGAQGFTGVKINAGKTIVEFNGTVGTVRRAFSTDLHRFMVRGEEHFANVSDPKIPAALAPVVMGIPSLNNFRKQSQVKRFGKFRRDLTTGEIRPLFTFTDVNGTFFGMGPADFAKIYNIPAGADGTGQSIAIVGRSNINIQDVVDFRNMFGLTPANNVTVILNGADPGLVSGDEGEADLDVEWSGAVAPKATIKFVVSESELTDAVDGVDASAVYIVDNNIAPVMSESFGLCEAANGTSGNAFQNALWQQAAAEGITVSVSSGDNGSAGCDNPNGVSSASFGIAVSGTASTPFNVAVGGTDFDDATTTSTFWSPTNTPSTQASAVGYIPEVPWNDSCAAAGLAGCTTATASTNLDIVAGSGGPSAIYTKPAFQSGVTGMPADGRRDLPDISLFAADGLNRSFYIICESDQDIQGDTGCNLTKFVTNSPFHDFQAVGGTSASAPAFAAIMALVNQKTGQRQGNANFTLYSLAKNETFSNCNSSSFTAPTTTLPNACVFLDVTKSNNAVPCGGGTTNCSKTSSGGNGVLVSNGVAAFTSGTGYDSATGLGSINVTALLNSWAVPTANATTTTISPATINPALGASQTITGTVTSGSGTPTGVVVLENALTGVPIDTGILAGNNYTVTTNLLPAGTYNIKAHYGGDGAFAPSDSATAAVSIGKQNSKVIVSFVNAAGQIVTGAQSIQYGSPYILRVDVANNSGTPCETISTGNINFVCPTGTVALLDNGAPLMDFFSAQTPNATNIAQLNDRGFVEDQPIQLNVGVHPITATYTADTNSSYISSTTTNTLSVTITQATTIISANASPSFVSSGSPVDFSATVNSFSNADKARAPSGTVQFLNGSVLLGTAVPCNQVGATASAGASCTAQVTATLSALPALPFGNTPSGNPGILLAALLAVLALVLFEGARRLQQRRLFYAGAFISLFLAGSAMLAGCGGGSSGGGTKSHTVLVTIRYSGDTNYAASQSTATVTVQ